ncbi:hypothetical protein JMJ77_0000541, partial [Colletotrichum scovillei]
MYVRCGGVRIALEKSGNVWISLRSQPSRRLLPRP